MVEEMKMKKDIAEDFKKSRERLQKVSMSYADKNLKRFFTLDSHVYDEGALPRKTKELLGLVSSLVLRCDDCISYHLMRCREEKLTDEELVEALSIGAIVGGSITIPHIRRAFEFWGGLKRNQKSP